MRAMNISYTSNYLKLTMQVAFLNTYSCSLSIATIYVKSFKGEQFYSFAAFNMNYSYVILNRNYFVWNMALKCYIQHYIFRLYSYVTVELFLLEGFPILQLASCNYFKNTLIIQSPVSTQLSTISNFSKSLKSFTILIGITL